MLLINDSPCFVLFLVSSYVSHRINLLQKKPKDVRLCKFNFYLNFPQVEAFIPRVIFLFHPGKKKKKKLINVKWF